MASTLKSRELVDAELLAQTRTIAQKAALLAPRM